MYLGSNLTKEAEVEEQLRSVGQHSEERTDRPMWVQPASVDAYFPLCHLKTELVTGYY